MRKNSPRKWLHACLDLLPVILIPAFMVYSHRHDVTENVQINYKYQSNEVNTFDDLVEGNIYHTNYINMNANSIYNNVGYDDEITFEVLSFDSANLVFDIRDYDEYIADQYDSNNGNSLIIKYYVFNDTAYCNLYFTNVDCYVCYVTSDNLQFYDCVFRCTSGIDGLKLAIDDFMDISDFSYTDYNVIESVDVENTNVMDSFMNKFNDTIDTHFNMGNVFNLTGVYDWFNTNIFNGNAPQIIYSVWNIALYELVMDLLFLLYGLFMWFIDMVQHLMDKPFKSIK